MTAVNNTSRIFTPLKIGTQEAHRVAMAPLTRLRAEKNVQTPKVVHAEYYAQRASSSKLVGAPTLLITEATFISLEAGGYPTAPGIYTQEQIQMWKKVTDAVHAKGGLIYCQLWALGRANQGEQEGVKTVSASPIPLSGTSIIPEEMTEEDIKRYVGNYKQAAINAVKEAGFDGVEIHSANGYLLDQFLQTGSNKRTDAYGGEKVENRVRFLLEVVDAITSAIGQERTAVRLSPWSKFQDQQERNPLITFEHTTRQLVERFPKLAYVHFVEPVAWFPGTFDNNNLEEGIIPSNDHFRAIVRGIDPSTVKDDQTTVFPDPTPERPTAFLSAGGFTRESGPAHCERTGDVVVYGRHFISTPDLPYRIKQGIEFNQYDRSTFYGGDEKGYTTYPFANDESKSLGVIAQA